MDNLPKEDEEKSGLMQTWADVVAKSRYVKSYLKKSSH